MYFLSDVNNADFAQKVEEKKPIDEKVGLLKKSFQFAVGKTPMGTLTRAASVAGIGGSLYGMSKMKTPTANTFRNQFRREKMLKNIKNAVTSNTAKNIGATAAGTVVGGVALNEGRKLYEKKTRKWWEVL